MLEVVGFLGKTSKVRRDGRILRFNKRAYRRRLHRLVRFFLIMGKVWKVLDFQVFEASAKLPSLRNFDIRKTPNLRVMSVPYESILTLVAIFGILEEQRIIASHA